MLLKLRLLVTLDLKEPGGGTLTFHGKVRMAFMKVPNKNNLRYV